MDVLMTPAEYDRLPDRQHLTGMPLLDIAYRDPGYPDLVFRWILSDTRNHNLGIWHAFKWGAPP